MQGYIAKQHHGPVRRYCRSLQLRDNPELIAAYRDRHAEGNICPHSRNGRTTCPSFRMPARVPPQTRNGSRWSACFISMTDGKVL